MSKVKSLLWGDGRKRKSMIDNKKSSILLILKVLEEYSDEEHYLTQQDIINKIKELYGLELERKSVAFSLNLLQDLDYDINKSPRGGYALLSRLFDNSEIRFMMDALFSLKSISGKQVIKLSKKLNSGLSKYQRKDYDFIYKSEDIARSDNKELFYVLDTIEEAKRKGKRISFQYLSYDKNGKTYVKRNGYRYIVSPYFSVNSNSRYYLICNYREKYHNIQSFRIDQITNIKIEDEWDIKPLESLKDLKDFNITKYLNENIYLLPGEVITASIELENESTIQYVIDWFMDNVKISNKDGVITAKIRCNENALFYWCMQYSETIKVVSPKSLVDRIKKEAQSILKKYQ